MIEHVRLDARDQRFLARRFGKEGAELRLAAATLGDDDKLLGDRQRDFGSVVLGDQRKRQVDPCGDPAEVISRLSRRNIRSEFTRARGKAADSTGAARQCVVTSQSSISPAWPRANAPVQIDP